MDLDQWLDLTSKALQTAEDEGIFERIWGLVPRRSFSIFDCFPQASLELKQLFSSIRGSKTMDAITSLRNYLLENYFNLDLDPDRLLNYIAACVWSYLSCTKELKFKPLEISALNWLNIILPFQEENCVRVLSPLVGCGFPKSFTIQQFIDSALKGFFRGNYDVCKVLSGLNEEHRKYFSNIFTTRIRIIRIARDWFEEGYPRFIDRFEPPSWIDKDEIDKYKNEWFMDVRIPPTIFFQKVWKMRIEDLAKEIVQSVVDAILLLTRADARLSSIHILDGIMGYSWVHLGRYVSSQDIYRINVREVASIRSELSKKIRQIFAPKEVIISPKQITLNYNIDLALDFYRAGTMKSVAHEKLIDWCIALEALFTDSHQEIARKLQERVSILIGRSDKEVAEISELIKKCYDIRSKIIHGDPKWKKEPLDVLLDKLQDYTRRSIHACRKLAGPRGYDSKEDLLDMLDKALLHTRERKALWKRLSRGHLG